jgi:hypothetical protein
MRNRVSFVSVLVCSLLAATAWVLLPLGSDVAQAAGGRSLDLCVVEPGFATPGDHFGLTTTGPKSFNDTQTLAASGCGSYAALPNAGTYTVTQSQTPSGWTLAQIYCYTVGSANKPNGTVDLSSSSATIHVNGPTACIFAETSGGGGSSGGFSGGTGSKSGTTTTTAKTGTSTTKPTVKVPIQSFCALHPNLCTFHP